MLPLADWVMRGRGQAISIIVVALVTSIVVWPNSILAAAVIALIAMRTGSKNGVELWFFALLPALLLIKAGSYIPVLLITASLATSLLLRQLRQWSYVLMAISAIGLITALLFDGLAQSMLQANVNTFQQLLEQVKPQVKEPELYDLLIETITPTFVAGMMGISLTISTFLALVLARYWQAGLYNPGGFQQEFHAIRLEKMWLIAGFVLLALLSLLGKAYLTWVWIVLFPLLVAGIALFHAIAKYKKLRLHWYVIFYFIVLLGDASKVLLIMLAITDSLFNLRQRLFVKTID